MIHKRSTQEPLPDHRFANLTANCGIVLRQAESVSVRRAASEQDEVCIECSRIDNEPYPYLPCVSFWEDATK